MAIVATVAESMAVVSTVQPGVSLGLRCGLSLPLAIVGKGGDNGGVLLHDGLANGVGDDGGNLMDSSLQLTVVTGNGDCGIGSNNVGLHGGGDGLVGDGLRGRDNGRGSIRE